MIYPRIVVVSLILFVLSFSLVYAGDILFETVISWFYSWVGAGWGSSINGGFTYTQSVSITYRPSTDQEVCTIKIGLYKSGNPIDSVVMTVRTSANNGSPIGGPVIATATLPADQVSGSPILPQQTVYTSFSFSPCLNLTSGIGYSFILTRTQPGSSGNYVSQISNQAYYPETSFWQYVPVNGFWQESINYEPALRLEGPEEPAKTPVLIIPGIAGSELKNGDDLIWADLGQMFLDINDQFLSENLGLDEDGQSVNDAIKAGEAIEKVLGGVPIVNINIFEGLRLRLVDSGYSVDQNLFYFPYDWRLDLTNTASLLADRIEEIKLQTEADKINIVAHSMGGLLAKEYIAQSGKESIDKLIFVGTPHLGAPKAGKIILAGDKMGIPWLEEDRVEEIGEHSIAVHELLPNQAYFNIAGSYIKQFNNLLDYNGIKQLLLGQGSTQNVFSAAEDFFNQNLENLDLSGISVYNIAGCANGTQGGYEVRADGSVALTKYRAGDQTVPLVSGDAISLSAGNKFYSTEGSHAELPSRPGVRNMIADILDGQPLVSYEKMSTDSSTCGIEGQELIWRSPVEVHIYDFQDRHTGPIEGGIEYGVPGIDYEIYGHEKFIFIPSGSGEIYRIVAHGLDDGTFDLSVRQNENGMVTGATIFNDIPVSASTDVQFNVTNSQLDSIEVDQDGDGSFISILATSILNSEEAEDITPPAIDIISSASPSYERSFILPVDIQISDSNSGILSSSIMLDGNTFSSPSIDLFSYSLGSHSLDITAIDRAGNTATDSFDFQVVATPNSTILDIERAYELDWIEKGGVKNSLINKLKSAIRIEKKIELLEEKLPDKPKIIKQIERLEKRLDKLLAIQFIKQLETEYNEGNINERAFNILKEDIEWLLAS